MARTTIGEVERVLAGARAAGDELVAEARRRAAVAEAAAGTEAEPAAEARLADLESLGRAIAADGERVEVATAELITAIEAVSAQLSERAARQRFEPPAWPRTGLSARVDDELSGAR